MKKVQFEARGWIAFGEVDDPEEGCIGPSSYRGGGDIFSAGTREGLLGKLADFAGSDVKEAELDSCDEPGRVDFGVMETDEGIRADESDIAKWRAGNLRLWYVVYTFHVERVEREPVSFN